MPFDYKKEFKELYHPTKKAQLVTVPKMQFVAVRGKGDPNQADGEYQRAVKILYSISYTIKMYYKKQAEGMGYFDSGLKVNNKSEAADSILTVNDKSVAAASGGLKSVSPDNLNYVVPPLEGFWWQKEEGALVHGFDYSDKSSFNWVSVIRLPDFVMQKDFDWAIKTATAKKDLDCSRAELFTLEEGNCVQIMHTGSYDDEPASVKVMHDFAAQEGWQLDFSATRLHHEIYLSDPRKTRPENLKTVIRHPVRKIGE